MQPIRTKLPGSKTKTPKLPPEPQLTPEDRSEKLPDFASIEARVFTEFKGDIYLGREKVSDDLRGVLRDEAEYFLRSRLWEVIQASIEQEAINLALIQSAQWDHVLSAKQLHHYRHFVNNVIHKLAKK